MVLMFLFSTLKGVTITDTAIASNLQVCLKKEIVRLQFSVGGSGTTGSYLDIKLPTGITWEGIAYGPIVTGGSGSNTATYAGIVSGKHRITFGSSTALQTIRIGFWQKANCAAGTSSFTTQDSLFFYEGSGSINVSATNAYNGSAPSLSITSISNTPATATLGDTVIRKYTITNGGFGGTSNFIIVDKAATLGQFSIINSSFKINPSGVNYSIPLSQINTSGDSVIISFRANQIQQISDLDSVLENGESFTLEYKLVINTCGVPTILSQLLASWRCPNSSRCNYYNVNTGVSTYGPALPNIIVAQRLQRKNDCYDGTTVWRDTLVLRNTGGPATNINMDAGGTYGSSFRTDLFGAYFDTASFYVRIGKNGIKYKPSYTVVGVLTGTYSGCNFTGKPNHIRFSIPYLGTNDSLYIFFGQVQCNYEQSCIVNQTFSHDRYFNGQGVKFSYRNACGNATYDGGWIDAINYKRHYIDGSNSGPVAIGDGETKDLSIDIGHLNYFSDYYLKFGNRAYREVSITLPNVIQYDPSYSKPVYFDNPTYGTLLPYYRSANGDTFKFRLNNNFYSLGTTFHAKVKGVCDGVTCSGILQYRIQFSHNPDTTYCTRENPEFCLNYPIAWTSSCIVCCPKGMVNLKYTFDRTNFGAGDDDNNGLPSGSLNKTLINTKRAIPGDTIEIVHKFYLKTDTVDTKWYYVRSIMEVSNLSHFAVISDSVFVDRLAGSDSTFSISPSNISPNKYNTDISFMPPFYQGDTVTVKLKLRVLTNPEADVVSFNSHVGGGASNDNFTTSYTCGSILDKLEIYGVDAFGYESHAGTVNGCQVFSFDNNFYTRIGPGSGTYSNIRFPYEYRPLSIPLRMRVRIPSNYTVNSVVLNSHNFPNQPLGAGTYPGGTNIPFTLNSDNVLNFDVRHLYQPNGGNFIVPDEGNYISFRVTITPTCNTTSGVAQYFTLYDSFSMLTPLSRSQYNMATTAGQAGSNVTNFHPNLIYSSPVPIATAYSKVVSWPLTVNNLTVFNADYNWLYPYNNSGSVQIDSLKEGSTLITPDANGFYRIGSVSGGGTRNFTVFGTSTACQFDSLDVYASWSCGGNYPTAFYPPVDSVIYAGQTNLTVNGRLIIPTGASIPNNSVIKAAGKIIIMPNVSIGTGTLITSEVSIDVRSPNLWWPSVEMKIGPTGICNKYKLPLYVQPQPAAIQTQVTLLNNTPSDPSNSSSSLYGTNTVEMCKAFPFEMEIQSTQSGNIYEVKETLNLPFNGSSALDYISDSGYIEYPIGTTPRKFSNAANSSILAQVPTGKMTLDLEQIDPVNFNSNSGLPGTGLGNNSTRRVILRWKMKTNCNIVSGEQWQPTQYAKSACGERAGGDSTETSGFVLALAGVTSPYVASIKIATGLDGCGAQTTQIRLEKIGAGVPQPTDSITVKLPKLVSAGSITCSGVDCPSGTITYTTRTDATSQYLTFPCPNTLTSSGDTLLYSFPMTTKSKSTCVANQLIKVDVTQQLTVYCGTPIPANLCPNTKASLGTESKNFDIRKAILNFSGYNSTYVYPSFYKYKFNGNINNTSAFVSAPTGVTLKTYMDVNNNLIYEKGIDALVKSTVISSPINSSGSVAFSDSFENNLYSPSPNLPMYTVIDTGDASANCFCGGIVMSAFNQALPVDFIYINALNLNNRNAKVQWSVNANPQLLGFNVFRKSIKDNHFVKVAFVNANNSLAGEDVYTLYNPIESLSNGTILYQVQAVDINQHNNLSPTASIMKSGNPNSQIFNLAPNPTDKTANIILNEGIANASVTVYDVNGKVVFSHSFEGTRFSFDISNWNNGVYSVVVKSNDWSQIAKLTVIK